MKRTIILALLVALVVPLAAGAAETGALGKVTAVTGDVSLGRGEAWRPAAVGAEVMEGEVLKTGAGASAEVLFEDSVSATVSENTAIEVSDLLLKTRLEQMKGKVSAPTDDRKVELQVTPTTGVRGTEQTEKKAEDLKRDHYWNENVK